MASANLLSENPRATNDLLLQAQQASNGYKIPTMNQSAPQAPAPSNNFFVPQGDVTGMSAWQTPQNKSNAAAAGFNVNVPVNQQANKIPTRTNTGNHQADFMALANQYAPSAKNLEQFFPQFQQMYPGSQLKKNASGYADAIILPDGTVVDTQQNSGYEHSDAWQWNVAGGPGYQNQFADPLTAQYESLLHGQMQTYQQQQAQAQAEYARQQATRAQTDAAVKRLTEFANQRVSKLQAPAYTGTEQEILRTQALDPIERDRAAAQQNALQNIGSRGFDPSSGIAQQLLQNVNQGYDQQRSGAQNDLASKQINEQRSRDQEAQQLLQYLAQLPEAAASGDMNFINLLNSMINQPAAGATATGGLLSDLPVQRTALAAQVAGLGGQPQSSVPNVLALLNNAQANRYNSQNQTSSFWNSIGSAF